MSRKQYQNVRYYGVLLDTAMTRVKECQTYVPRGQRKIKNMPFQDASSVHHSNSDGIVWSSSREKRRRYLYSILHSHCLLVCRSLALQVYRFRCKYIRELSERKYFRVSGDIDQVESGRWVLVDHNEVCLQPPLSHSPAPPF